MSVLARTVFVAAAVLAAAFLFLLWPLPQPPTALPVPVADPLVAVGSLHVHTNRSDGSGSPDEVAAAAARSGLDFVVLTDHGDGTRAPDRPRYRSGVLVIDGVELSTQHGHYLAIGLPQAPYPLRGEARDVVEDVRRLGGFGVVAHPDSSKPALQWRAWDVPFDAVEWLNADSEWRDENRRELSRALARYVFRPSATLGSVLDRPDRTLDRWDTLTRRRRVVAVAGADAHARLGWGDDDANGYRRGWFLKIPSYDASFGSFAMRLLLDRALDKDPAAAATQILDALRLGRAYTAIDAIATPATLEFRIEHGRTIIARTNAAHDGVIVLRKDGRVLSDNPLPEMRFESAGEGTYRVEVYLPGGPGDPPVPWIVSNPIYVRPEGWGLAAPKDTRAPTMTPSFQGGPWHVETDETSSGHIAHPAPEGPVAFTYRLGSGNRAGQYAALGIGVGTALGDRTHLAFRAHASRPMRMSVQARNPQSGGRWQRSVYLDSTTRDVIVRFDEMTPVGSSGALETGTADTVLFVVDTTNTSPGTSGTVTIGALRVEK
jgi:hypothetical protein